MKICIDTNIIFNSYYIKSSDLRLLLNFINNHNYKLLISSVVIREIENHYNKKYNEARQELQKALRRYNIFRPYGQEEKIEYIVDDDDGRVYNFIDVITNFLKKENIIIFGTGTVPHESICDKIFHTRKPFKADDSGYKDALIWLSLLEYLRDHPSDEAVVFLSMNTKDFSTENGEECLHDDLRKDMLTYNVNCEITYNKSVSDFIKSHSLNSDADAPPFKEADEYITENLGYHISDSISQKNEYINDLGKPPMSILYRSVGFCFMTDELHSIEILQKESDSQRVSYRMRVECRDFEIAATFNSKEYNEVQIIKSSFPNTTIDIFEDDIELSFKASAIFDVTFSFISKYNNVNKDECSGLIEEFTIQDVNFI